MTVAATTSPLDNLVQEHLPLVYAAALRQCRDPHDAADVIQAVFLVLQRKLPTLSGDVFLPVWLLRVTRYACLESARRRRRRATHEQRAAAMRTGETKMEISDLSPLLDEALHRLTEKDRTALVLAYLHELPHDEVGRRMGLTTAAAHKRIQRALAKLRSILSKKSTGISTAAIGAALTLLARPDTAPAAVQSAVSAAVAGQAPATVQFLAKGTLLMMNVLKAQSATVIAGIAVTLTALSITIIPAAWAAPQPSPALPSAEETPITQAIPIPDSEAYLPVVTLTLQEFRPANTNTSVDLDNHSFATPNWGQPSDPPFGLYNWAANSGTDLVCRASSAGVHLMGIDFAAVLHPAMEFDINGPAQLMVPLLNASATTETLSAQALPAMYVIRTREGGVGMLELVSATPATGPRTQDAKIEMRIKMLTPAARDRNAAHFANLMIFPAIDQAQQLLQAQTVPADITNTARALDRAAASLREITKGTPNAAHGRAVAAAATVVLDAALVDPAQIRAPLAKFTDIYTPAAAAVRKPRLP